MATCNNTTDSIINRFTYQKPSTYCWHPDVSLHHMTGRQPQSQRRIHQLQTLWWSTWASRSHGPNGCVQYAVQYSIHTGQPWCHSTSNQQLLLPLLPPKLPPIATGTPIASEYTVCTTVYRTRSGNNIRTLQNTHTGYARVTTLQLLTHLYTTYGRLTLMAMQESNKNFYHAYNPAEPFEMRVQQIEDAQAFVAANSQAYSAEQIVSNAYSSIHNTVLFIDACHKWQRFVEADKTWANFKIDSAQAHIWPTPCSPSASYVIMDASPLLSPKRYASP
jgi:hypothetical protein